MKKRINIFYLLVGLLMMGSFFGCQKKAKESDKPAAVKANVHVTGVIHETVQDSVSLSATSYYYKRNTITAPFAGYITSVRVRPGIHVHKGQILFEIQTRESRALTNNNGNNKIIKPIGSIPIRASASGQIISLNHYIGDFVTEGSVLCNILNDRNLYFRVYVPYDYQSFVKIGDHCNVELPGNRYIKTRIVSLLSNVDNMSQSAIYLSDPVKPIFLPEGMNVTAYMVKKQIKNAQIVPKSAVLSDETMTKYWVMKLINDSTAVNVPVKLGYISTNKVQIIKPEFKKQDRILVSGNYGLPDTALVNVIK